MSLQEMAQTRSIDKFDNNYYWFKDYYKLEIDKKDKKIKRTYFSVENFF